jgi:hypothetical protein
VYVANSQDVWADIRITSEKLSDLSARLREAVLEARTAVQAQQDRNSRLHFELLQNLKKLADQIREILWRELQSSATSPLASPESRNRAAELFTLLARIAASQQRESPARSFFEEIESAVERTLSQANQPSDSSSTQESKSQAA